MSIAIDTDLYQAIADAKQEVEVAQAQYDDATGEWVEVATYRLNAAKTRLSILIRQVRGVDGKAEQF